MQEVFKFLIALIVLVLGIPIGNFLAKVTSDELEEGKLWFIRLIALSLVFGVAGLLVGNDVLMFTFFFIAVVTSRSLVRRRN